ncbi:hypothetical protein Tco_1156187 [Tanacetum coccineum]
MTESSQNPLSPNLTPKEEPVTLDKPKSPNPFLPAIQVEVADGSDHSVLVDYAKIIWEDLIHKLNKKTREKIIPYPRFISLLLKHMTPNYDNEELIINPTQMCLWTPTLPNTLLQLKRFPKAKSLELEGMDKGTKNYSFDHILIGSNPSVLVDKTKSAGDGLKTAYTTSGANKESRADDISRKVKLEDLSDILKDTRSAIFTPDSPTYEPIIFSDESEEEENVEKDKDAEETLVPPPPSLKSAQIQELMAQPLYPDINHLTELLVTSLKPELSKLLASHDFASYLLTELKELPSKITGLSGEIKELKQHIKYMEIELPGIS